VVTPDLLFALPVAVRRCRRNPRRLVIVSATGEVLLRTLSIGMRDQDIAERFVRAMNEWGADAARMKPMRYGISRLKDEDD
jgi:hypothetical protein